METKDDLTEFEVYGGTYTGYGFRDGFVWGQGNAAGAGYISWVNGQGKEDGYISGMDEYYYGGSACGAGFAEGGVMAYEK